MDPCSFVKVLVGGLALRIPVASKPTRIAIHPTASPCFCEIKLANFPTQTAVVPLISQRSSDPDVHNISASFHLEEIEVKKLSSSSSSVSCFGSARPCLEISIYTGRQGSTCGVALGKLLGKFTAPIDLDGANEKPIVFHSGWVSIGKSKMDGAELHVNVRAEPDLRYVFQFDGDVASSPQIFQIQGSIRQPIFSCKFTCDRTARTRSMQRDSINNGGWSSFGSDREQDKRERKGWLVMIHDLSGSPVAAASMVTPFVPSPGSDRVSRSNPGAWLILRPDHRRDNSWIPWGRLEAWRERGNGGGLGTKFELMAEGSGMAGMGNGLLLAESVISARKGGKFLVDTGYCGNKSGTPVANSPVSTPRSSGDFSFSMWPYLTYGGFVMSSTVQAEGKCSKPTVQLAMRHVTCMEDAAAFVALSAAVDLSMDACQLFTRKLKQELCQQQNS